MSNINRLLGEFSPASLFARNMSEVGKKHERMHFGQADFASAAEELTFQFSESMERKMKSLSTRSFQPAESTKRAETIEKLRALYELLDNEFNQQNLKLQAKQIYQYAANGQEIKLSDANIPAASYILLKEAHNFAFSNNNTDARLAIEKKLEELDKKDGRKINAGLNTAEQLHSAYKDSSKRDAMRHIYYQSILGSSSLSGLMHALLDTFGERDLSSSINVLTKAVLEDMNALRPSSSREHLSLKLKDLNGMNCARSLINDCKAFIGNIKNKKNVPEGDAIVLTKSILTMTSGSIFSNDLHRLANEFVGSDPEQKLVFLNSFFPFVKSLPQALWNNAKSRMTGLDTMLAHMENETIKLQKQKK